MTKISITETVRGQLRAVLLEDKDLIEAVERQEPFPDAGESGHVQCETAVAIRRPLDLETAILREIRVSMRSTEDGWEVYDVEGLEQGD